MGSISPATEIINAGQHFVQRSLTRSKINVIRRQLNLTTAHATIPLFLPTIKVQHIYIFA